MKILIIGHFGGRNLGDELILYSQMKGLSELFKKNDIEFVIYTYDENFTKKIYSKYGFNITTVKALNTRNFFSSLKEQYKKIKNIDLAVLGGGGLIQDIYFSYGVVRYLVPLYISLLRNVPLYSLSLGVYHIENFLNKILFKNFLKYANGISVRDKSSLLNIKKICPNIEVFKIPDSVFLLKNDKQIKNDKSEQNELTVILREFFSNSIETIAEMVKYIFYDKKIRKINLIIFENSDIEKKLVFNLEKTLKKKGVSSIEIFNNLDPLQYLRIINSSKLIISGRLHGILPAFIFKKSTICLSYAPKIDSFCTENKLRFIRIEELNDLDIKKIDEYIMRKDISVNLNKYLEFLNKIRNTLTKKPKISLYRKVYIIFLLTISLFYLFGKHILIVLLKRNNKISKEN